MDGVGDDQEAEAGAGASGSETDPSILDIRSTTSQRRGGKKRARLWRRLTELEYYCAALLRCACLITLTCADEVSSAEVQRAWHRVQAWLMRHGYKYYLVTSPIQERRAKKYGVPVRHVHVVVLGHRTVPVVPVRAAWGLGATRHVSKSGLAAVTYAASYTNAEQGGARLSWSYPLLQLLPAGARPHASCLAYVAPSEGFPGGVVDVPWGHYEVPGHPSVVFVPSQHRFLPRVATSNHSLLWTAYRLCIDWESVRARIRDKVREENAFIERFRREGFADSENPSCFPTGSSISLHPRRSDELVQGTADSKEHDSMVQGAIP